MSHPNCERPSGHVCQKPSARICVDCDQPAGTLWGPMWCPECDANRLDHVSRQMESLLGGDA